MTAATKTLNPVTLNAPNALQSIQDQLRAQLAALRNYVPPTTGAIIKTKGRVFTMPDGSVQPGPIQAVILDWIWVNRWDKTGFKEGVRTEPTCLAFSRAPTGMIPNKEKSEALKHTDCDSCPMNQWGSNRMGGNGKDCKNGALLAIVPPNADSTATPWLIRVSPTGLKSLTAYINRLSNTKGVLPLQVVTEIKMKDGVAFPTLEFGNEQPHGSLETMFALQASAAALLAENLTTE